jgi:putative transposase
MIRVEGLDIRAMTRSARGTADAPGRNVAAKAGLNRGILKSGCVACGYACNADVNAARNIAAGHTVKARGGDGTSQPVNREPQLLSS